MEERDKKRGGLAVAVLCGIILILLPVLYVLSIGPFTWLLNHKLVQLHPWTEKFYWPITWACEESDLTGEIIGWWQNLI